MSSTGKSSKFPSSVLEKTVKRLVDDVAIVTGGSSGIGEAIARLFAAEGAAVMIVHHDRPDGAQRIVDEIILAGGKAGPIEKLKEQVAGIPMKRAAAPAEVADLALDLASKQAGYASGATFTLDGALSMNLGQGA